MSILTLAYLRQVNVARCTQGFRHSLASWSLDDWMTATGGELGEAMNVAKKLNRVRDGLVGNSEPAAVLRVKFGDELADTVLYTDLMAASEGLPLAEDAHCFADLLQANEIQPYLRETTSRHLNIAFRSLAHVSAALESAAWYNDLSKGADTEARQHHLETASAYFHETLTRLAAAAHTHGLDLGHCVIIKFNATSEKLKMPHRLVPQ